MGILVSISGYIADLLINKRLLTITQVNIILIGMTLVTSIQSVFITNHFYLKVRKYFVCGATVLQTICMIAAGFLIDPVWSVVLIIVSVGSGGFTTSGYS